MLTYPQIATGAVAQYPVLKSKFSRTLVNTTADGRSVKFADPGAAETEWHLSYQALSDDERTSLEDFFQSVEGRLHTFTFLDPMGNLLAHSDDLTSDTWERDPLVAVESGIQGPASGTGGFRLRNSGSVEQRIRQTLDVPGSFQYCLSVYARQGSGGSSTFTLSLGGNCKEFSLSPNWQRYILAGSGGASDESVTFDIGVTAGSMELFGVQVEAQPGASSYKKSGAQGGVCTGARFKDDQLRFSTDDINHHSCLVKIIHADHL